jgi:Ca2+-transporting ATPase
MNDKWHVGCFIAACETMGNATNICSDKTGTLTQNKMTVVDGWVAGRQLDQDSQLHPIVMNLLSEGISVNSTAVLLDKDVVLGNKTEGALILFLKHRLDQDYSTIRANSFDMSRGDKLFSFSSSRKRMSVLVLNTKDFGRLYTKGAAEIILESCDRYLTADGKEKPLDASVKKELADFVSTMARKANRCIAVAHRAVPAKDLGKAAEVLETGLVLNAIFGIKDPLRPDVTAAVKSCQNAGVFVRMITGDNIETAKAIATECGILTEGGVAIEGPDFRKMTPQEVDAILPNLQVIGRCSPEDKHLLVNRLNGSALPCNEEEWQAMHPHGVWNKDKDRFLPGYRSEWVASRPDGVGDVVGVTGDGTNDAPALKVADVGLSMGISGTEGKKHS